MHENENVNLWLTDNAADTRLEIWSHDHVTISKKLVHLYHDEQIMFFILAESWVWHGYLYLNMMFTYFISNAAWWRNAMTKFEGPAVRFSL